MCNIPWPSGHACGECGDPAVVAYGYAGSEDRYACADHDPLGPPFTAAMAMPGGFRYVKMAPMTGAAPAPGRFVNCKTGGSGSFTLTFPAGCTASAS